MKTADRLSKRYFRICSQNCASANRRGPVLEKMVYDFDVVCLQKTRPWPNQPLVLQDFTVIQRHQGTRGCFNNAETKKAPGPDNITNEMLLHLGPCSKRKLLQLFNDGWRTGTVPQVWREAIMIPILKRAKDKSQAESYRPISLTSCVGKLMERLINTRLMWHLEDKKHITPEQAAFRQDRSTEDQITYIAQAIEGAFQDKKHTLAVWIDIEKTFDKVWKECLKLKLHQCWENIQMDWTVHAQQESKSPDKATRAKREQGVPQGGVLSPTLFLIFIRDILHRMTKNIQTAIYADDLALWCSEEYITTANYRLQQALQVIESWARSWLIKVNEKKTTFTIFSLSNQKHSAHLKLNGQTLHQEDAPTYFGVTLDRRLTWKNQLKKNQARAKIRLVLMKKTVMHRVGR